MNRPIVSALSVVVGFLSVVAAVAFAADDLGLPDLTRTYDAAVADFDGDGITDVALIRHQNRKLTSDGPDGIFMSSAPTFWFPQFQDRHGCGAGDFDGDGDPDLYCTKGAGKGSKSKANELWINQGDGTFNDEAASRGVVDPHGRGRFVEVGDFDGDANLDIYVTNKPRTDGEVSRNTLFLNDGTATFMRSPWKTEGAGCPNLFTTPSEHRLLMTCGDELHLYEIGDNDRIEEWIPDPLGSIKTASVTTNGVWIVAANDDIVVGYKWNGNAYVEMWRHDPAHNVKEVSVNGNRAYVLTVGEGCTNLRLPPKSSRDVILGVETADASVLNQNFHGCADHAIPFRSGWLILNGDGKTRGPLELIEISP